MKNIKKIICLLFIICLTVSVFVACNNSPKWGPYPEDATLKGEVIGQNGGMAIQKGGYLYFINGMTSHEDTLRDNEFGEVIKGSICRIPMADLNKPVEERNENLKIIVPKVFVANYDEGGFYIFGDYIYYTTPNSERGSSGGVQNTWVDFMKVKIDGSGTTRLAKINPSEDNGIVPFKFYETGENKTVYLIYYLKNELFRINATTASKSTRIAEKVVSYAFGTDKVFFTQQVVTVDSENKETIETHTTIWEVAPSAEPQEISAKLGGFEAAEYEEAQKEELFAYSIVSFQKDVLFFTRTLDIGGINPDKALWGYNGSEIKPFSRSEVSKFLAIGWDAGIIAYTNNIFYLYPATTDKTEYDEKPQMIYSPTDVATAQYFIDGDYLYFGKSSGVGNVIWRFDITKALTQDSETERVTLSGAKQNWLNPKIVDGKLFFINEGGVRDEDGDLVNKDIEDGFVSYTYFVSLTDLPEKDPSNDDLEDEILKEIWIGKYDQKDKKED